jgi:hypothetical protein
MDINWEMIVAESRPVISPPILKPLAISHLPKKNKIQEFVKRYIGSHGGNFSQTRVN